MVTKTESAKGVTGQEISGPGSGVSSISGSVAGESVVVKRSDITNESNVKKFLAMLMNTILVVRTTAREDMGHGQVFIDNVQPRLITAPNKNRLTVRIRNIGNQNVYIGSYNVSIGNGYLITSTDVLPLTLDRTWGAVYGISDSASGANCCWIEE